MRIARRSGPILAGVLAVYLGLLLPTVTRQGINWDEQTDLTIARAYASSLEGLLYGVRDDALNTRLPMVSVALLFRLTGGIELTTARLASCAVGLLAIVGLFLFCRRELDSTKALVAAAIVATSPYYLYFSAVAFTEGDVFVACTVIWLLVCAARLRRRRLAGPAALTGLALGLAISSKVSAVVMIPALGSILLGSEPSVDRAPGARLPRLPLLLALLFVVWLAASAVILKLSYPEWAAGSSAATLPLMRFGAVAGLWLTALAWARSNREAALSKGSLLTLVLLVGATTFFVVPPVHTTNPWIAGSLIRNSFSIGAGLDWGFVAEAAFFHFAVLLLKPGLLVGALLWIGIARGVWLTRSRPELRLPTLFLLLYLGFVLLLPWAQSHYLMAVFPIAALLAADLVVDLFRRRRAVALALGTLAVVQLAVDFRLTYPDLNLNGYQWVGERYLAGRSSLGYRGIARVGSDGAEQVLLWTAEHVRPGDRVVAFIEAPHIVRASLPTPPFELVDGLRDNPSLDDADYVLTTLNADILHGFGSENPRGSIYRYRYDRRQLEREFERVFVVERAFDLEFAAVWRRREPA